MTEREFKTKLMAYKEMNFKTPRKYIRIYKKKFISGEMSLAMIWKILYDNRFMFRTRWMPPASRHKIILPIQIVGERASSM